MKKKLSLFLLSFVFAATGLFAQNCTPLDLGGPNILPPTENLSCVERGQAYSETVFIQNFSSVSVSGFQATVNFLRIDSVTNLPCGLDFQINTSQTTNTNVITSGDSACISIYGTSYDFVGQYKIGLYLTVEIATPIGNQTFTGEAVELIRQIESMAGPTGLNFNYWLRVIEDGGNCPNIDTTSAAWNLSASTTCPGPSDFLVKALSRKSEVCLGDNVELYAVVAGGNVTPSANTFTWTPNTTLTGANTNNPTATPTASTTYSVEATDGSLANATDAVTVGITPLPNASYTYSVSAGEVTFTNTSTNATTYSWDYGDQTAGTAANPVKTYLNTGDYDVFLTATNACGSDVDSQQVTIASVGFCNLGATCSPQAPTGDLGLSPIADNVSCADKGVFYQQYLYLEVPSSITFSGINATINFLEVSYIENLPCGISYRFDKLSGKYLGGETGCLELFGITDDAVGQYDLAMYITLGVTIPGLGTQEFSGRANELIARLEDALGASLGIDFDYWVRVKTTGSACPALDRTGASNLTASCEILQAVSTGSSCDGANGTLTGVGFGGYPPYTVEWGNGATTASIVVDKDSVVALKVTDSKGNVACGEVQLLASTDPVSDFGFALSEDLTVKFSDNSSDALTYAWDFGDQNTSTDAAPEHQYSAEGTFTVTLTVTNDCGTDVITKDVLVEFVGINYVEANFNISIMPNPNDGLFYLNINADKNDNGVLTAYDMSGKVVYRENLDIVSGRKAIDLGGVAQGVYVLELRTERSRKIEKLVIK